MLHITYSVNRKRFEIDFSYAKGDDWDIYIDFFHKVQIYSDSYNDVWILDTKRITEMILWFKREDIKYLLHETAINKIKEIKENIPYELKINRKLSYDESVVKNITPFEFQKEDINFLLKRNRTYNTNDTGVGKTVETIATFSSWFNKGLIDSLFVITRSTICYHWYREILEYSPQFTEDDIVLINNETKVKPFENNTDKKIMIVSRDHVGDIFGSYKKDYKKTKSKKSGWRWKSYANIKSKWNKKNTCLVIDEAHDFGNPYSMRTKALFAHKEHFDYRMLLSATPAINSFEKYYAAFKLMDESVLPMSYEAFKLFISKEIGDKYSIYSIKEYDEFKIKSLQNAFSTYMIKRMKKDLKEMKTKQFTNPQYLKMSPKHYQLYEIFMREEILKLEDEYDEINLKLILADSKFPYLAQIVDNPLLLEGKVENEKFNSLLSTWKPEEDDIRFIALKEKIEDLDNIGKKLIIFDNHPLTIDMLAEKFKEYSPLVLHGQTKDTMESKQEKIDLFNDVSNKHKLFLINPTVGGAGIDLNIGSNYAVYYTVPFDTTATEQSLGRNWRINNVEDAYIFYYLINKSIDNIRYLRNVNRIKLNSSHLNKSMSVEELKKLLDGII